MVLLLEGFYCGRAFYLNEVWIYFSFVMYMDYNALHASTVLKKCSLFLRVYSMSLTDNGSKSLFIYTVNDKETFPIKEL